MQALSNLDRVTAADQYPDLEFATLDVGKEGDPPDARVAGWVEGLQRGFQHPRPNDDFRTTWLEHVRADRRHRPRRLARGAGRSAPARSRSRRTRAGTRRSTPAATRSRSG